MATQRYKTSKNMGSCGAVFFCSIFFAIGTGITWFLAIAPMLKTQEAAKWHERPCVVKHIDVHTHHGDGATYSPEVSFTYSFNGLPYTSDQFWFGSGSYGDRRAIEKAIAPFQAGGEYPCYVNPNNPSEAVLTRQVAAHSWLGWLFGGIFSAVGLVGMIVGLRSFSKTKTVARKRPQVLSETTSGLAFKPSEYNQDRRKDMSAEESPDYTVGSIVCPVEEDRPDEPLILAAKGSRLGTAIGTWVFALIWNAIAWPIAFFAYQDLHWFALAFMGIFLLIGLVALVLAIYSTLQLWNPRTTVVCSQRNLYPGSEFEISWLHQGNTSSISELNIELVGEESATYRQGTSTRTDKSVFFKQTIIKTSEPTEISNGFRLTSLPADTMHTFEGMRNAIKWHVSVRGKIRLWPDIHDEFSIVVYPPLTEKTFNAKS